MHTQGKWTVKEPTGYMSGLYVMDEQPLPVCKVIGYDKEDKANLIVQTHNSFDGLLEACKDINRIVDQKTNYGNKKLFKAIISDITRISASAIAEAESIE